MWSLHADKKWLKIGRDDQEFRPFIELEEKQFKLEHSSENCFHDACEEEMKLLEQTIGR